MILVTLDTSPASESALDVALRLATAMEVQLELLVVLDGQLRHHFAEESRERGGTVDELAQAYVDELVARRDLHGAATRVVHGVEAGQAIVEQSDRDEVELLVMATHGRTGLRRFYTGSVAAHVVKQSSKPVVVVPQVG